MPCNSGPVRRVELLNRRAAGPEELVESDDIRVIQKIERFGNEIEFAVLADFEVLQQSQIKLNLCRGAKRIRAIDLNLFATRATMCECSSARAT